MNAKLIISKIRFLYCVDPKRLSIRLLDIAQSIGRQSKTALDEKFLKENEEKLDDLFTENLPIQYEGVWYFASEDDARVFVQCQIGL